MILCFTLTQVFINVFLDPIGVSSVFRDVSGKTNSSEFGSQFYDKFYCNSLDAKQTCLPMDDFKDHTTQLVSDFDMWKNSIAFQCDQVIELTIEKYDGVQKFEKALSYERYVQLLARSIVGKPPKFESWFYECLRLSGKINLPCLADRMVKVIHEFDRVTGSILFSKSRQHSEDAVKCNC